MGAGGRMQRTGCWGLSPQLDELLAHRIYPPDSVDAVLQDTARLVDPDACAWLEAPPALGPYRFSEVRANRPLLRALADDAIQAAKGLQAVWKLACFTSQIERMFPSPEHSAAAGYYATPEDFLWGGPEELVIAKGSDWCHEVARVLCGLAQVSGIATRLVYAYSDDDGHVLVEYYVDQGWVLVDPLAPKVYRSPSGRGVGVREVLLRRQDGPWFRDGEGYYVSARFFKHVAIAEYRLSEAPSYKYPLSKCNRYYKERLGPIWNKRHGHAGN
jgi:hypothetical protein